MSNTDDIIVVRTVRGFQIQQRHSDGYVNATQLCKAANRRWDSYYKSKRNKEFIDQIGKHAIEINNMKRGRPDSSTWVHPQVAVHLAAWCSSEFEAEIAKWCSGIIQGDIHTIVP